MNFPPRLPGSGPFLKPPKASAIENDSGVPGPNVADALDVLEMRTPFAYEMFEAEVEPQAPITGQAANSTWVQTDPPCTLEVELIGGTYLLAWSTEIMRTESGSGSRILSKVRDETQNTTRALYRRQTVQNGSDGGIPDSGDFGPPGDVESFSGIDIRHNLSAGPRLIRLYYAIFNNGSENPVMRIQNQRLWLLRIAPLPVP